MPLPGIQPVPWKGFLPLLRRLRAEMHLYVRQQFDTLERQPGDSLDLRDNQRDEDGSCYNDSEQYPSSPAIPSVIAVSPSVEVRVTTCHCGGYAVRKTSEAGWLHSYILYPTAVVPSLRRRRELVAVHTELAHDVEASLSSFGTPGHSAAWPWRCLAKYGIFVSGLAERRSWGRKSPRAPSHVHRV